MRISAKRLEIKVSISEASSLKAVDVLSDKSSDHSNEPENSISTSRTLVVATLVDVVTGSVDVVTSVEVIAADDVVGSAEVVEVVAEVVVACVGIVEQLIQ